MDASNIKAQPGNFTSVVGGMVKINKFVVFGLNTIFLLPFVIRNYSVQGLATYLAAALLLFIIVFKSSGEIPAVAILPVIILADVATYIGVNFLKLKTMVNMEGLSSYFSDSGAVFWILFLTGLAVGVAGIANKKISWVTGLAGGMIGISFILPGWSNCDLSDFQFSDSGAALLLLFVIFNMLWTVILYIIVKTVPEKATGTIWIGIVLLSVFILGLTIGMDYIKECLPAWKAGLIDCPHTIFAWWKVILSSVVLLAGSFALYVIDGIKGNHLSVDTYGMVVAGEIILTAKILMSIYFSFNGLILVILIAGTFKCMKNDYAGRKTLKLNSITYLIAQYCTVFSAIFLLKNGLWINVVLSAIFFAAFYVELGKPQKTVSNTAHWVMILLCIVSEAVALAWHKRFSMDLFIMLVLVLGAGILTILIINIRQPGGRTAPSILRKIVCVCVAVLCLAAVPHSSVKISFVTDEDNQTTSINVEPKGKNNSIISACYYWKNIAGETLAEDMDIPEDSCTIPIENEILTVVVEDARGFITRKIVWYPYWLRAILD